MRTPKTARPVKPNRPKLKAVATPTPASVPNKTSAAPRFIVGIGASAGGLEALRALIGSLKKADNISFIVVQHLAPQHRSRLVEIIGAGAPLHVKEVQDGEEPRANVVYITPPNADVIMESGALRLRTPDHKVGPKPSVDLFFRSLAEEIGENAIGVILSGTGTDGSQGIRAIKAAGGITICQRIESAKYDGMPRAAKQTGAVDMELTPEEMAKKFAEINGFTEHTHPDILARSPLAVGDDPYHTILAALEQEVKVDFKQYKQSTIRRRLERRMIATHCNTLQQYAEYILTHPDESRLLFQDILISVTSFFRDGPSFRALSQYIYERVKRKPPGQSFRAWVVGCATGEEAYSIAVLVAEAHERAKKPLSLQIFATDLDEQAMATARKGLYPAASLVSFDKDLQEKYFETKDECLKINETLRDKIVFARHDATRDPPFLKLDLITCRNVLIYFNNKLQEHVLRTFHYALDSQGVLFLGKSEATATATDLFEQADKNAKIFRRSDKKGDLPRTYSRQELTRETLLISKDRETTTAIEIFGSLVSGFAPDSVLLDEDQRVRHTYGDANKFLQMPKGEAVTTIAKMVPSDIAIEISSLIHRADKTQRPAKGHRHFFKIDGESRPIQLSVVPISYENRREFLVCFNLAPADVTPAALSTSAFDQSLAPEERIKKLEQEVIASREHLQTIIEEHETANEELQALNEELQSANEELQSTNEELETANEELQSSNEELTTLNEEVNIKSAQLQTLNIRLQAIQNAIAYPLLMVDKDFTLIDFNPASRYLFRVTEGDRGNSLKAIVSHVDIRPVIELAELAFEKSKDQVLQYQSNGREFEARVQLYRGHKEQIEGAVLSFAENTQLVNALQAARIAEERLSAILDNTPSIVTMKDTLGVYTYVNRRFYEMLEIKTESIIGKTDEEIFGKDVGDALRERDFDVLKARKPLRFEEQIPVLGKNRYWLSSKFPLLDAKNKAQSVCTISLDITERVLHEQQLEIFKKVVASSNYGMAICESGRQGYHASFVSHDFATAIGTSAEKLEGKSLAEILRILFAHTKFVDPNSLAQDIRKTMSMNFTANLSETQGKEKWVEVRTASMNFGSADPQYVIITIYDINERVRTQKIIQTQNDELAKFSKLAALGEVAAGISHEINTPLNVITTKTDLIRRLAARDTLDAEKAVDAAQDIERMAQNIANVVSGLKSITGLETGERQPYNLATLIEEAVRICDFRLEQIGVKPELHVPMEEIWVDCYPVQIVQILINLLNNAVDAITDLRDRWIRISVEQKEKYVEICVTDSGKGIDPKFAEKIMTPFFTTKKGKKGTGLGLSLSRTIARRHGGDLSLVVDAKNTCFRIEIPLKCN